MRVEDLTGRLSDAEKQALLDHVIDDCYSTPVDRAWLHKIVVRDDGATDYEGYWDVQTTVEVWSSPDRVDGLTMLPSSRSSCS